MTEWLAYRRMRGAKKSSPAYRLLRCPYLPRRLVMPKPIYGLSSQHDANERIMRFRGSYIRRF